MQIRISCRLLIVTLAVLSGTDTVRAQYPRYVNIFNYSTDARHVALGGDGEGSLEGPSLIFPHREMLSNDVLHSSFGIRPPNWNTNDPIPFHTIALHKDFDSLVMAGVYIGRNVSGRLHPISLNAKTFHGNVEPYQLYFVGFFNIALTEDLSFGLSGKMYSGNNSPFIFFGISSVSGGRVQGTAYLMDAAVQKKIQLSADHRTSLLVLRGGFTNIGSDVIYNDSISFSIPRSMHIDAELSHRTESVSLLYKVHSRKILNPGGADEHFFFSGGVEAGYRESVYGRIGMVLRPYDSIFGREIVPQLTAGVGFKLKSGEIIRTSKFVFSFDAAIVPFYGNAYPALLSQSSSPNAVFTVTITYPMAWTEIW